MSVIMHYQIIGRNIRECRLERNLTQEQLAELVGIGQQFLSRLERGKGIPSVETVMALCDALHVNSERLLERSASHDDNPPCRLRSDSFSFDNTLSSVLFEEESDKRIVIHLEDLPLMDVELPDTLFDDAAL